MEALLRAGANVNTELKQTGWLSFTDALASQTGHTKTVEALLRAGANANAERKA